MTNIFYKAQDVLKQFFINSAIYFKETKKETLKDFFKDWTKWEKAWLAVSTIVITLASIFTWDPNNVSVSVISLIASVTGILCVVLVAKGKIVNYIFGLVNVIFYAIAAYNWQVYGDFMLNAFYYLPMQFIGWYIWTKPGFKLDENTVKAEKMTFKAAILYTLIAIVGTLAYGYFLQTINNVKPYVDAALVVLSVLAQFMMIKRYAEQWLLWILVDIIGIYIWAVVVFENGGLGNIGILVMYISWLVNALYGYINWLKMTKKV